MAIRAAFAAGTIVLIDKSLFVWQAFVRSWIQQQVRQTASEALHAAREAQAKPGQPDAAVERPRVACDVGFVFALGIESGGLEDLLKGVVTTQAAGLTVREGNLRERTVAIVTAGVGQLAAARGTQALIAGHRPSWVISAGFAGGLDPRLKCGDVLMADSLISVDGRRLAIDLKISPESVVAMKGLHLGPCVASETILHRPADKAALGRRTGALAVDMESWAVGEVCRQAKTRFLAIRVISDAVDDELPADVETLARQTSTASRLGAAAGAIFRRPSSIKDMLKLKEDALIFSDRLARFLAGVVEQLAPKRPESEH
jgi:adenosylhomocysteine nucleosidase